MLLAYVTFSENGTDYYKLCLVPGEEHTNAIPVRIDVLGSSEIAPYYIGPREAVNVQILEDEQAKVIWALPPAVLFLTPDNPVRPGLKAMKIKVVYKEGGKYEIFFTREVTEVDKWAPWSPMPIR